jgi:hypothetical protein
MSSNRTTDNISNCPAKWGHGNRTFTDYRIQQDVNDYTQYNVMNNNQYRLMLQRQGQQIIDKMRQKANDNTACEQCK